jgi:hypothetical protein
LDKVVNSTVSPEMAGRPAEAPHMSRATVYRKIREYSIVALAGI